MKRKLVLSVISLIVAVLLGTGITFAWFGSNQTGNTQYYGYTGTADAEAEMFLGLDENFDGILDEPTGDISTRQGILANQYMTMDEASREHANTSSGIEGYFNDIYAGRMLTYKIVLRNKSQRPISVDVSFGNMQDNFYDALSYFLADPDRANINTDNRSLKSQVLKDYYSANSAKLLFGVTGLRYTIYSGNPTTDTLTTGFNTVVSTVSLPTELSLWQYSDGQSFVGQPIETENYDTEGLLIVQPDNLVEIDFRIACVQNSQSMDQYITNSVDLYYQKYVQKNPSDLATYGQADIQRAISQLASGERSFIYSSEDDSGEGFYTGILEFEIPYVRICGTLIEGGQLT